MTDFRKIGRSVGRWLVRTLWSMCRAVVRLFVSLLYVSPVIALVEAISYYVPVTPVGMVAAGRTTYSEFSSFLWVSFPYLMMWGVDGFDSGTKGKYPRWTLRNPWGCWMLLQLAYLLCAAPLTVLINQGHPIQPPPYFHRNPEVMPYWLHGMPLLVGIVSGILYMLLQYPIFRRFSDIEDRQLIWVIPVNTTLMQLACMLFRYNPFMVFFCGGVLANTVMNELARSIALRRIERDEWKPSVTPGD